MSSRILSDPFISTTIQHGDTLQFVNSTPRTVWASVAEWKAADFAKHYKRKDLKSAWEAFVAPGPVSVEQMMDFFVKYRLSFTCLNVAHEIIRRYKADDEGGSRMRGLGASHLYFIQHNNRMYRLDKEVDSFLRKHFQHQAEPIKAPPQSMRAPRAFTYNLYAADHKALVNILRQPLEVAADRQTVSIAYGGDIENLYLWFKTEHDYEVQPVVEDRRFKGLRLHLDRLIIIHGGFADAAGCPKAFNDAMNAFKRGMFHESHRSVYSDDLFALFHHGKKAQLWRRFDAQAPDTSVGVDVKSAYPAAATKLDFIPVFLKTDRFRPYNGERIEDYSIYLVRNINATDVLRYIIADRPLCGVTGFNDDWTFLPKKLVMPFNERILGNVWYSQTKKEAKDRKHILFVFDDCLSDAAAIRNPLLTRIYTLGRHVAVSGILISQHTASLLSPTIKGNSDIILWSQLNKAQLVQLSQSTTNLSTKDFVRLSENLGGHDFQFLLLDNYNRSTDPREFLAVVKAKPPKEKK